MADLLTIPGGVFELEKRWPLDSAFTQRWTPTYPPARRGSDHDVDFGYLSDVMGDGVTQYDDRIHVTVDMWTIVYDVLLDEDKRKLLAFYEAIGGEAFYLKAPTLGGVFKKVKPIGGAGGRVLNFRRTGPETWSLVQKYRTSA